MRKAVPFLALLAVFAACGDSKPPASTPTATVAADRPALAGYSAGVRKYYSGANLEAADQPDADAEEKFFQPPRPARARLGEKIRLTGSNIGVQVDVTPTAVKTVTAGGKRYTAVELEIDNNAGGITVYDGELRMAALTSGGKPASAVWGVKAPCSHTFDSHVRIDVSAKQTGCLLFPKTDAEPEQLQLAVESVPTDAGGIWTIG
jgi:hypothetical protein